MNRVWRDYKWAILTFTTVCIATVLFPYVVNLSAYYYMTHSSNEISTSVRTLMATGVFVAVLRVPIIVFTGAVIAMISIVLAIRRRIGEW